MAEVGRHLDGLERELSVVDREGALHDRVAVVVDHLHAGGIAVELEDERVVLALEHRATDEPITVGVLPVLVDAHVLGHHVAAVEAHDGLRHVVALAVEEDALLEAGHAGEQQPDADGLVVEPVEVRLAAGLVVRRLATARASGQGQERDDDQDLQVVQVQDIPFFVSHRPTPCDRE